MENIKKKLSIVAVIGCTLALCFTLMGCSGGGNDAKSEGGDSGSATSAQEATGDARYYAGEWVSKSEIVPGQGEVTTEQYKIIMNGDGTFAVQDNGSEIITGTWEAQSATAGTAKTSDGKDVRLEIAGGTKLIFDGSQSEVKKIICVR